MKTLRCDKCIYWETWIEEGEFTDLHKDEYPGRCRRYPPQLDAIAAGKAEEESAEGCESDPFLWWQPITESANWCGEWKLREEKL